MGITSKVFNGIAETVKGLFNIRAPVFFVKAIFPFFPVIGIPKIITGRRKNQGTVIIKSGKVCHKFTLEFIPKHFRADKKVIGGFADFSILREPAAGNNAVHMYMVGKFLIPCVEHLDDTGCCPEPLLIRRQFQKCFGAASVKEIIQKLLVTVNERV